MPQGNDKQKNNEMKIKVSEATATQLDWLACKALHPLDKMTPTHRWVREGKNRTGAFIIPLVSTDWSQGGPIIDREGISTIKLEHEYGVDRNGYTTSKRIPVYGAVIGEYFDTDQQRNSHGESYGEIYYVGTELVTTGPTPLIAAMRCFVASKLGDEVEVPDELA